ncbi:hypothetical protein F4861DRAFT_249499 [Xylaria intraflava]|nr:hypothetical protein F4861DRAFT_249499 [Xylaria intraflava]
MNTNERKDTSTPHPQQTYSVPALSNELQQQDMTCHHCRISFDTPLDSYRHTMECHPTPSMIHPARLRPPPSISTSERIAQLEWVLRHESMEPTRRNAQAILSLYRQGKVDPDRVIYAQGGVIYDTMPAPRPGTQIWTEQPGAIFSQYMQAGVRGAV